MLVDARSLPDGSVVQADVCIVGSGPAGLALARALRSRSVKVCVIEAGGQRRDESNDRLAQLAPASAILDFSMDSRLRQLGGTAMAWDAPIPGNRQGVRMRPLDRLDFEPRDWVPDSGWPFRFDEVAGHYARAERALGLRSSDSPEGWPDAPAGTWPVDSARVRTSIDQFARRQVIRDWAADLVDDEETQLLLWANATGLEVASGDASVELVRVACLNQQRHSVRASTYVLAAGGIENARLLLLSGHGLRRAMGSSQDLVGRFFMDHIAVRLGTLHLADPVDLARIAIYDIRRGGDTLLSGRLQLREDVMRAGRLLNGAIAITPRPSARHTQALAALRFLYWHERTPGAEDYSQAFRSLLRSGPHTAALLTELMWRQRRFPPTISSGWSGVTRGGSRFAGFDLELQLELPPRAENRVNIGEARDELGMPRANVDYRFGELEHDTVAYTRRIIEQEIADSGLGRFIADETGVPTPALSLHHHLGTTRMHESPSAGVVDANAKVHGLANLYVAGSSVFPTGGYANPTLTIIALALRLADHLA